MNSICIIFMNQITMFMVQINHHLRGLNLESPNSSKTQVQSISIISPVINHHSDHSHPPCFLPKVFASKKNIAFPPWFGPPHRPPNHENRGTELEDALVVALEQVVRQRRQRQKADTKGQTQGEAQARTDPHLEDDNRGTSTGATVLSTIKPL